MILHSSLTAPDAFFEPELNRKREGFAGMALAAASAVSLSSKPKLGQRMREAITRGDTEAMKKAFWLGAPWIDPESPYRNALAWICESGGDAAIDMLAFFQTRGASALGPALRGPGGYVFGPALAIGSGQWVAARYLAAAAAEAFLISRDERLWPQAPRHRAQDKPRPAQPRMAPEFIAHHGHQPLTQALEALFHSLESKPKVSAKNDLHASRLLGSALSRDLMSALAPNELDSLLGYQAQDGKGALSLAVAADAPATLSALLDAGALRSPKLASDALLALSLATTLSNPSCAQLLTQAGVAKPLSNDPTPFSYVSMMRFEERLNERRDAPAEAAPEAPMPTLSAPEPEPLVPSRVKRRVLQGLASPPAGKGAPSA